MWSAPKQTQSIADTVAYIALKFLPEEQIDLQELYELNKIWKKRGDNANAIFDTTTTGWDAISKILATGRTVPLRLWNSLTQLRTSFGGIIGLDYVTVEIVAKALKVEIDEEVLFAILIYNF